MYFHKQSVTFITIYIVVDDIDFTYKRIYLLDKLKKFL